MELEKARQLAKNLLTKHGLTDKFWYVDFDNSKVRFGHCDPNERKISLSKHLVLLNDEKQVKDTILHEIAHALAGCNNGHNKVWKKTAKQIGCNAERCYGNAVIQPPKTYIGTCENCGRKIERFRRRNVACGTCCKLFNNGRFSSKFLLKWNKI